MGLINKIILYTDYPSNSLSIDQLKSNLNNLGFSIISRGNIYDFLDLDEYELINISSIFAQTLITDISEEITNLSNPINGNTKTLNLKLGELPDSLGGISKANSEEIENDLGLTVQKVNPQIQNKYKLDATRGLVITNVLRGSTAESAGFQQGDLILEINKKSVNSLKEYRNEMDKIKKDQNVLFLIKRGANTIYVALKA